MSSFRFLVHPDKHLFVSLAVPKLNKLPAKASARKYVKSRLPDRLPCNSKPLEMALAESTKRSGGSMSRPAGYRSDRITRGESQLATANETSLGGPWSMNNS